jgi:hypothetical protein
VNEASLFDPETIINPFYAVSITDDLFKASTPRASTEDWVLLNAKLIEDIGVSAWLSEFLDVISQPQDEYDGHDIINPALAVSLSAGLQGIHEPLVERSEWIAANAKLMKDTGITHWLEQLLSVLSK